MSIAPAPAHDTVGAVSAAPIAAAETRLVPAVERAVRLLDALAAARRPLSLAELARMLELPKSSVHGLMTTLTALGLARRDDAGEFTLGAKPLQWADVFSAQSDVLRAFEAQADHPALRTETTMLAVLDGADVMYLACRQGSRPLAVNFRVGGRFPACRTSTGKAIMATLPTARVRELVGDGPLPRLTRRGVATTAALLQQLEEFRELGYAVDDEETAEGMQCFGAPIFGTRSDEAIAAVAVSVIKAGLGARRRQELVAAIRELADAISRSLGADRPQGSPAPRAAATRVV
ncbi:MAG: IclR family transcriptional regulator [Limnobacter sp.]|nr:IclR family transcriptional regulator [Limnobacter sp.]